MRGTSFSPVIVVRLGHACDDNVVLALDSKKALAISIYGLEVHSSRYLKLLLALICLKFDEAKT